MAEGPALPPQTSPSSKDARPLRSRRSWLRLMAFLVAVAAVSVAVLWALFGRDLALNWAGGCAIGLLAQVVGRVIEVWRARDR